MGVKCFEVLDVLPTSLLLSKKGGSWPYNLKHPLHPQIMAMLEERKKQNWGTLAFAIFPPGEKLGELELLL